MAYSDIWTNANDAAFQGKCRAAIWDVSNRVINDEVGFPASGQEAAVAAEDTEYALKVLRDVASLSDRVLAMQVLRNATIAASPSTASDSDIQFQVSNIWAELRRIG